MQDRFQAQAAWPLCSYDNRKFWEYVYNKNKVKEVQSCLSQIEFSSPRQDELSDVVSPKPSALLNSLYIIFTKKELKEMISQICNSDQEKADMHAVIDSMKDPIMNYCLIALGLLLIAASCKLQIMLAIASALAGITLIAVTAYRMQP